MTLLYKSAALFTILPIQRGTSKNSIGERAVRKFSSDDTIFLRVVEPREGKIAFASESVKYDGKVTTDSPSREFLEVTNGKSGKIRR